MPLTAMSDMPDGLQALKRENLLGYEHVLGSHVWTGDGESGLLGLSDGPGGGIDIPQSTGIPIHVPDFNSIKSPGDFGNAAAGIISAITANKLVKKGKLGAPASGQGKSRDGSQSSGSDLMPYLPWAIGGVVVVGLLIAVSKGRS